MVEPRGRGIEYRADGGYGELYLVTNAGATEARLVTAPGADGWREVVPESADTRLAACDVFGRYLVLTERCGAATRLRILDRGTGARRLIEAGRPHTTLKLAGNPDLGAARSRCAPSR